MPETAPNTPNSPPVDVNALVIKHRAEIDRIKSLSDEEARKVCAQYGYDIQAAGMLLKSEADKLDREDAAAVKKVWLTKFSSFFAVFATTFFTREKFFKSKTARFLYTLLPSVAAWFAGTWAGAWIFGRKIQEKVEAFKAKADSSLEQNLALAIENTQAAAAAQKPDMQETRKALREVIGNGAAKLGLVSEAQRDRALEVQARFLALANTGQRLEAGHGWDVMDDVKWQQTASAKNIGEPQMAEARKTVMEGKGLAKEQAPALGDIMVAAGFVSQETRSAYLTAQAAERTLECLSPDAPAISLSDTFKKPQWQRIGSAGDPPSLQSAQAVNFLAASLGATYREAGAGMPQDVKDKIANAQSALSTLSVAAFENAAALLGAIPAAKEVALRIDAVAKDTASKTGKGLGISREETQRAVDILKAGLDATGQYMTQKGTKWPAAEIDARLALARGGPESPAHGYGRAL